MSEEQTEGLGTNKKSCCSKRAIVGSVAVILLIIGIAGVTVTCFILEQKVLKFNHHYGVVFDAGSSHTDVTVYQWPSQHKDHGTARTKEMIFTNCSGRGISSYVKKPEKAGEMVKDCIENVVLKTIPHKDIKKTPIYLGATAGMRLLCKRDNSTCQSILDSIRQAFKQFTFRQTQDRVQVISGKEEASFGWVSANLQNGAFKETLPVHNNSLLNGALDLGGGSAEISFLYQEDKIPAKDTFNVTLYGTDYSLYSHSYLCYGANEARRRLLGHLVEDSNLTDAIPNPCFNKGFNYTATANEVWLSPCSKKPIVDMFPLRDNTTYTFMGTGLPEKCDRETQKLFNKTALCPNKNCTFDGVYQPQLSGNFLAYAAFGKTAKFLNISATDDLLTFKKAARQFCSLQWEDVAHQGVAEHVVSNICFQGVYSNTFLTHGLKFPENTKKISFVDKVDGAEIGWSLGFMVNKTNDIPVESPTYRISQQEFVILLLVSSLLTIIGLAMLVICIVKRKMEKNVKYKYSMIQ